MADSATLSTVPMRSIVLGFGVAGALLLGCGSDVVEPVRCSTGPLLTTTSEPCQLTVEGSDGPTRARLIRLHASEDLNWADFAPASDAGLYLLAEAEGPELVVVRLGPALEHEWSLALAHEAEYATLGPFTVGPAGVDLVSRATGAGDATSWLTHVDDTGRCSDSTQLVLGGDTAPNVQSLVRDGERLVVGGIAYPDRAFVQSRSASDGIVADVVVAETELLVEWGYIEAFSLYRGGPERYLAHYRAYAPQGIWANYFGSVWLDEALTSPGPIWGGSSGFDLVSYQSDADGQLYSVVRDAWDFESPDMPPPTSLRVTSPSGEPRELMVPQPDCGWLSVRVRDEALQVVHCLADDESLLGYASAGAPTWTATLACPNAEALQLGRMHFDAAGRLWSFGSVEGERVLVVLEW